MTVNNIMLLVSCVLTERRLIFHSKHLEKLSQCIHGLLALIYPFRWQHIFVPILPEQLLNYLGAPMPFIIGVKSHLEKEWGQYDVSDIVVVDLDHGRLLSTMDQSQLPTLPEEPGTNTHSLLFVCFALLQWVY